MVDHLQSRVTPWRQYASHVKVRGTLSKMDVCHYCYILKEVIFGFVKLSEYAQCISYDANDFNHQELMLLSVIRQPIWQNLKILCSSFRPMGNNAQFLQIPEEKKFPANKFRKRATLDKILT